MDGLLGSEIVLKCWKKEYATIEEVLFDLTELIGGQGLEIVGDDIRVDGSVHALKG